MRRRIGIAVGFAVVAIALVLWRCHGSSDTRTKASVPSGSKVTAGIAATGARAPKPDPRTQPRGSIAGTVRDDAKAPIAGATVCADLYSEALPSEVAEDPICVVTGAGVSKAEVVLGKR